MSGIVIGIHVFVSLALIIIVLLQAGKGADMGAAFGGASKTVFGPSGAAGPMAKITVGAAVLFMLTSLYLTWALKNESGPSVMEHPSPTAPAIPGPGTAPLPIDIPTSPSPGGGPISLPPLPGGGDAPAPTPAPMIEIPSAPSEPAPGAVPGPAEPAPSDTPP